MKRFHLPALQRHHRCYPFHFTLRNDARGGEGPNYIKPPTMKPFLSQKLQSPYSVYPFNVEVPADDPMHSRPLSRLDTALLCEAVTIIRRHQGQPEFSTFEKAISLVRITPDEFAALKALDVKVPRVTPAPILGVTNGRVSASCHHVI